MAEDSLFPPFNQTTGDSAFIGENIEAIGGVFSDLTYIQSADLTITDNFWGLPGLHTPANILETENFEADASHSFTGQHFYNDNV